METNVIMSILLGLFMFVVLVFVLREVFCWYWKINAIISNQKITNDLLQKLLIQMGGKVEMEISEQDKGTVVVKNIATGETEIISITEYKEKLRDGKMGKDYSVVEIRE